MANAKPWTASEVDAAVADYLHMLTLELSGQHYVKTQHRHRLKSKLDNRSNGSIEYKHQNISAAIIELGFPYIPGYKPLPNYQRLLFEVLSQRLAGATTLDASAEAAAKQPAILPIAPDFETIESTAPQTSRTGIREQPAAYAAQMIQRDYLALEARNQSLEKAGEELIVEYERYRLHGAGKRQLSDRVEHVAITRGDGLGYDVLSFDITGRERLIEVKTTAFGKQTPFYITRNELALSREASEQFHLYRVFDFRRRPQLFNLPGPVDERCHLDPATYIARF